MSPPPPDIPLPHQLALNESSSSTWLPYPKLPNRGQVMRVLTLTQNTSAMVFSIFLIPHLASPLVASVVGLEGADKTMMIARDLYLPLEPFLIYIPLGIHFTSSFLRRLVILSPPSSSSNGWSWKSIQSKLPQQTHQIIAYPLTILLIFHVLTHRLIPSSPNSPISSLSPSELNYEFVGHNLRDPISWIGYLGMVGLGVYHSLIGGFKIVGWLKRSLRKTGGAVSSKSTSESDDKIQQVLPEKDELSHQNGNENVIIVNGSDSPIPPKSMKSSSSKKTIGVRAFMVAFLGIISIGLWRIRKDTGSISNLMRIRYDAVYQAVPWAGLWR